MATDRNACMHACPMIHPSPLLLPRQASSTHAHGRLHPLTPISPSVPSPVLQWVPLLPSNPSIHPGSNWKPSPRQPRGHSTTAQHSTGTCCTGQGIGPPEGSNPSAPPSSTAAHPAKSPSPRPAVCHLQPASGASKGSQSAGSAAQTDLWSGGWRLARPTRSIQPGISTHPSIVHPCTGPVPLPRPATDRLPEPLPPLLNLKHRATSTRIPSCLSARTPRRRRRSICPQSRLTIALSALPQTGPDSSPRHQPFSLPACQFLCALTTKRLGHNAIGPPPRRSIIALTTARTYTLATPVLLLGLLQRTPRSTVRLFDSMSKTSHRRCLRVSMSP